MRTRLLLVSALVAAALTSAVPRPAAAAPVHLPPVTRAKLKSGLTVLVMPTRRLPLVDMRLVARAGAVNDPSGKEGLASLTADLVTQGAGKRNARQFAEDIAFVGGSLDAGVGAEQFVVTCEVLKKDLGTGLEMFHDAIAAPTFPAEEFARKKDEALGSIASERDDPSSVADVALLPFVLGSSPLAHPAIGWEKSVQTLTREDVLAFHRRWIAPDNALLAVVGDVDPKTLIPDLERRFADWKPSGAAAAAPVPPLEKFSGRTVEIVNKPEVTQTQIRMTSLGVPRNHPDYYPIVVANLILGGGFTSRLVNAIRVEQGLTYSISTGFRMYRDVGTFNITTFTRNETLRKTIDETLKVIERLVSQGPSEEELAKAKRYLTGQYPLGLQAPDALAQQILDVEFFGLDPHTIENFDSKVNAVTMAEVKRVLGSRFNTHDLKILVVSNPDMARKALAGLGPIEVKPIP